MDHHPGNSGCGCLGPANGWRAAAAKAGIELGAELRLEEKGGGMGKVDLSRTPPPPLAAFTALGTL